MIGAVRCDVVFKPVHADLFAVSFVEQRGRLNRGVNFFPPYLKQQARHLSTDRTFRHGSRSLLHSGGVVYNHMRQWSTPPDCVEEIVLLGSISHIVAWSKEPQSHTVFCWRRLLL